MAKTEYRYGMRLRGASPGAQPRAGLLGIEEDPRGKYHNILVYSRRLTVEELKQYELEYLWRADDEEGGTV